MYRHAAIEILEICASQMPQKSVPAATGSDWRRVQDQLQEIQAARSHNPQPQVMVLEIYTLGWRSRRDRWDRTDSTAWVTGNDRLR